MTKPLPPATLAWLRQAAHAGQVEPQALLHLLEHLEALEKKYETQRLATLEWGKDVDRLMRWSDGHLKRIMALEQRPVPGTVELAAPATDEELERTFNSARTGLGGLRACYNLGRQHSADDPIPPMADTPFQVPEIFGVTYIPEAAAGPAALPAPEGEV